MKLNKLVLVSILLLTILSLGAVYAQENSTSQMVVEENLGDVTPVFEVFEEMSGEDMQINIGDNLTASVEEVSGDDVQKNIGDNLTASVEDVVGDMTADNVTVDVSNVFGGQNATISVTAPGATGCVNISVGEKLYTPEFIGGVATQTISEYSIGSNNVTVKYNDIVKETSFKVLDGVITNETLDDYFEISGKYYQLRSFIPEGATLDFRGYINRNYKMTGANGIQITKPCNIISTTHDAEIGMYSFQIQSSAGKSNVSNIKCYHLSISASNCAVINTVALSISYTGNNIKLKDSTVNTLEPNSNSIIINCTVNNKWELRSESTDNLSNVSVFNSTFNNGIYISVYSYNNRHNFPIGNLTLKNCVIRGKTALYYIQNCLIENCIFYGYLSLETHNVTIKNNLFNVSSSTHAIVLYNVGKRQDNKIIGNRIYSKDYCGNNAIIYQNGLNVSYYPELSNIFENNTPTQTDLNIGIMSSTIFYDENTTVAVNMQGVEGDVVFYINNKKISTVKLVNGVAKQTIDKYEVGINNVTVVYEDLNNNIYAVNHTSFNVNKIGYCPMNVIYNGEIEEKTSVVTVILPNDAKGTITLILINYNHSIIIKQEVNGSNNIIRVPALFEGNYTMSATFDSVKYVVNSTRGYINVVHIPVYKLNTNNVVMDYKDGSKYKVLVTKDGKAVGAGEVVKITFNGKTKNVKTDKSGYATLTLDAAPKTYTIKAVYNGVTKSSKVTIKNVLKASNISKKKAKTIKFSAILKTSKGKAIVGKKITFKLKGKTYNAKTNKKGVATISITNLKVGKYIITSKYGVCTVKNTINIKK